MATILKAHKPQPKGERLTFHGWLAWELRDRHCEGAAEFARRYGFALSTVCAWLSGRRTPSVKRCRELADLLDLTVLEVVCAAGHLKWQDIDDYTHAYAGDDTDNWATIGDL